MHRGHRQTHHHGYDLLATARKVWIGADDQRIGLFLGERREGGIDFAFAGGFQHTELQGKRLRRRLRRLQFDLSRRSARIHEKGNRCGLGHHLVQQLYRFDPSVVLKKLMPVTFPPGRFRLVTNPWVTGSPGVRKTIGIVAVAAFAGSTPGKLETMTAT